MLLDNLQDKKVTVMGIGLHGGALEVIEWLAGKGAKVLATDLKSEKELESSIEKIREIENQFGVKIEIVTGEHRKKDFADADLVVKGPAVPWDNEFVEAARENGVPVVMDSTIFFEEVPKEKIIGVTGSKGKSTTASLIAHILEKNGKKVARVGIDREGVVGKIEEAKEADFVVFELSSWRLSGLGQIKKSPHLAVITNIFPDHLNYYGSMEKYIQDKENIFLFQEERDFLVIEKEGEYSQRFGGKVKSGVVFFEELAEEEIGQLNLLGRHNLKNISATIEAMKKLGISEEQAKESLKSFSGLEHRMEFLGEIDGTKFYNDTAATMPDATISAIDSLSENVILIAGGASKNLGFEKLARKIADEEKVKGVFLLNGTATDSLRKEIEKAGGKQKIGGIFDELQKAVLSAFEFFKKKNAVVLFSPGCASFGMFQNEFDRGDKFKKIVEKIKKERKKL